MQEIVMLKQKATKLIEESRVARAVRDNIAKELEPKKQEIEAKLDKDSELYSLVTRYWEDDSDANKNTLLAFISDSIQRIENV